MKKCVKCGGDKAISEFYKQPGSSDGVASKCKECQKQASQEARYANLERYREYDRTRGSLPHRRAARDAYQKTENGKETCSSSKKSWITRNHDKRSAHIAVGNALRDKKLTREPCCVCRSKQSQAHHPDYAKPFEVVWLCTKCHAELHRAERAIRRAELLRHAPEEDRVTHPG